MKNFDSQIKALSGKIRHHLDHEYKSPENRIRNRNMLEQEYNRAAKFPADELSPAVWDEMNDLAEDAGIGK